MLYNQAGADGQAAGGEPNQQGPADETIDADYQVDEDDPEHKQGY